MDDIPAELLIASEVIEPTFAYMIGRWFSQAEYMKDTYGLSSGEYENALVNLWLGVNSINRLCNYAPEARHCAIVTNKRINDIAQFIENEIGVNPIIQFYAAEEET